MHSAPPGGVFGNCVKRLRRPLPLPASLSARRTDADISLQHHQRRGGGGGGGRRGCARWKPGPLWISSSSPSTGSQPSAPSAPPCGLPALQGHRADTLHFSGARSPVLYCYYPDKPLPLVVGTNRGKTLLEEERSVGVLHWWALSSSIQTLEEDKSDQLPDREPAGKTKPATRCCLSCGGDM